MPRESTIGRLMLEDAVPEDVRPHLGTLDKKGLAKLTEALAAKGPDVYREAMKKLTRVSTRAGYESGGYSFGPEDMDGGPETKAVRAALRERVQKLLSHPGLDAKTRDAELVRAGLEAMEPLQEVILREHRATKNPLALQVDSGAKGKAENLRALVAGDVMYTDQNYKPIPFVVEHSFAEGLRPHEYAASTFGARQAIGLTKLGTAQGGYLSKRMGGLSHRLVVVAPDGQDPHPDQAMGFPVDTSDPDNENTFLAHPAGDYPRNTHLTREVLADLKRKGVEKLLIRSPLVGGPGDGGVYGYDVGVRERGRIAPVGDHVGRAAADSISEPVTQTIIGCLTLGTQVRMADWSIKTIESIRVGDMVIGVDEAGRTRPVQVTHTFDNGVRECVRTVFVQGKRAEELILESTPDHKILSATRMSTCKEAALNNVPRQLPVGKRAKFFYALPTTGFEASGLLAEPRALLLGLLLGDGCFTEAMGDNIYLSCGDPSLIVDLGPYLASLNLRLVRCQAGDGLMYRFSQIEQAATLRCPTTGQTLPGLRNPARQLVAEFGLAGKYSYEKFIPDAVMGWDNDSVAALLLGLFITDGSVYQTAQSNYPFAHFGSTSRQMVERYRELMSWRFGLHFGPVDANTTSRERPLYGTELARFKDVARLREVFGTIHGIKRVTYDTLLDAAKVYQAAAEFKAKARSETDTRASRRSQVSIGPKPTYDIEVDCPSHLFLLANGLVVSNSKHGGGVAGQSGVQQGFPTIERMFSVPSVYQGGVTHAQRDGIVTAVRPAPQGGHYVVVDGEEHYVHPDLQPTAKVGDRVEAGDSLSDGVKNPAELVRHKGIGEGRRQFVQEFMRVARANGVKADRRNVELVARGFIDHVHVDQEMGEYAPGEIAPYTSLAADYEPRPGHRVEKPDHAKGLYLERPTLHYSIGTRVTPSVARTLGEHGVPSVVAHPDPPPFSPVLIRSNDILANDRDWTTQMLGSGLERSLVKSVARGAVADPKGTSFVPALAEGINFGAPGTKTRGWDSSTPPLL